MCGRLNQTGEIKWRDFVTSIRLKPVCNAAPTEILSLIRGDRVEPARWWLVPSWAKEISTKYSMFNARSENLTSSKAFRVPFQRQRGIVPISSFIEWRGQKSGKQPWLVTNEQHCFYAAALWDVWNGDDLPCSPVPSSLQRLPNPSRHGTTECRSCWVKAKWNAGSITQCRFQRMTRYFAHNSKSPGTFPPGQGCRQQSSKIT